MIIADYCQLLLNGAVCVIDIFSTLDGSTQQLFGKAVIETLIKMIKNGAVAAIGFVNQNGMRQYRFNPRIYYDIWMEKHIRPSVMQLVLMINSL